MPFIIIVGLFIVWLILSKLFDKIPEKYQDVFFHIWIIGLGILVLALLTVLVWGVVDSISTPTIKIRDCIQLNFNGLPYDIYYNNLTQKFYRLKVTFDELLPAQRLLPLTTEEANQVKLILENIYQETKQYIDILSYGWQ